MLKRKLSDDESKALSKRNKIAIDTSRHDARASIAAGVRLLAKKTVFIDPFDDVSFCKYGDWSLNTAPGILHIAIKYMSVFEQCIMCTVSKAMAVCVASYYRDYRPNTNLELSISPKLLFDGAPEWCSDPKIMSTFSARALATYAQIIMCMGTIDSLAPKLDDVVHYVESAALEILRLFYSRVLKHRDAGCFLLVTKDHRLVVLCYTEGPVTLDNVILDFHGRMDGSTEFIRIGASPKANENFRQNIRRLEASVVLRSDSYRLPCIFLVAIAPENIDNFPKHIQYIYAKLRFDVIRHAYMPIESRVSNSNLLFSPWDDFPFDF